MIGPAVRAVGAAARDRLLTWIIGWTTLLTGILFWLPLCRGLIEGDEYQWGLAPGIGGRGTGGAYGLVMVGAVYALALLYLGRRGARMPFHLLLLAFHLPLTAAVIRAAIANPGDFRFEGASLGLDIPLAVIGPATFGLFAALALLWVARDLIRRQPRRLAPWRWTRVNVIRIVVFAALVPLQIYLLRGPLGSAREIVGVLLTVSQWFLLNRALNARSLAAHLQAESVRA